MKCESRKCSPKLEELNRLKAKFWWVPLAAKLESTDNGMETTATIPIRCQKEAISL